MLKNRDFNLKIAPKNYEMTLFDQFRRGNSNILIFIPLKIVIFETKIKNDSFASFSRILSFWTKNGHLTHCDDV